MKVVNFSNREMKKLPALQISDKILNTEASLYVYSHKKEWNYVKEIIKVFYNFSDEAMTNKLFVITKLLQYKESLDIPELVMPNSLVSVAENLVGYKMPFIENINLSLLLANPNVSLKQKLGYLKEIYLLLQKIENNQTIPEEFFLGDIHESNFILNIDTQKVNAIDLDSAYFKGAKAPTSKFLTFNDNLWDYSQKYPLDIENDRHIPNHNTTILSFIYMLLNILSEDKSYKWNFDTFYNYLNFLEDQGLSHELIVSISKVYEKRSSNEFDVDTLRSINCSKNYSLKRSLN